MRSARQSDVITSFNLDVGKRLHRARPSFRVPDHRESQASGNTHIYELIEYFVSLFPSAFILRFVQTHVTHQPSQFINFLACLV